MYLIYTISGMLYRFQYGFNMHIVYVYISFSLESISMGCFNKSIIYEIRLRRRSKHLPSAYLLLFFVRTTEGGRGGINDPKEIKRLYTLSKPCTGHVYIFDRLQCS